MNLLSGVGAFISPTLPLICTNEGEIFQYTYDAVGNRLTETTTGSTTLNYTYDNANRLATVEGVAYTWDNNGNLLSDGVSTYTYDHSNQLTGVSQGGVNYTYAYNGLGERLRQTVGTTTTNYVVDSSSGLSQVLSDGTYTYLYGLERISQTNTGGKDYFLGDALGSVRQMANTSGGISLSRNYEPYGTVYSAMGNESTAYGFTSEWTDRTGLVNLRARYYDPVSGRFLSRDSWEGDYQNPITLNKWAYANTNPMMYTDPSGKWTCAGHQDCEEWVDNTLIELSKSGQTGKEIVEFFEQYDKTIGILQQINSCNQSVETKFGVHIIFGEPWPGPSWGTAIFRDVLQLSDDPRVINSGTPGGFGLQLFGHEVSHWAQGMIRYTIQGELLSRYVEQQLREDLMPEYGIIKEGAATTKYLVDTFNPFYVPDLQQARDWMEVHFSPGYYWFPLPSIGYLTKDWLDQFHVNIDPPDIPLNPIPLPVPTPSTYPIVTPPPW